MPLDTNFMVVSVILGGLLVWSMTQKVDKPPVENTYIYNAGFDAPDDVEMEEVVGKKPTKDSRAPELKDAILRRNEWLISQRNKFDTLLREPYRTGSIADLERKQPELATELRHTIAFCSNWSEDYIRWRRMLVEMDEGEWVKLHMPEFSVPTDIRNELSRYEDSVNKTLNVKNYNQLNVAQRYDTMPQSQEEYSKLNANQRYNVEGDDAFMVDKPAEKPRGNVFMNLDPGDDMTIEAAQRMHGETNANPPPPGVIRTSTVNVYNTLNYDGRLGAGSMEDRAQDHDMRDSHAENQKVGGDRSTRRTIPCRLPLS